MKRLPPIQELRRVFNYDPETGILTWKITRYKPLAGTKAGWLENGYRRVEITGKKVWVHRICYAIYHGVDPYPMNIDHINHDRSDNRIENLRLVTHQENQKNMGKRLDNTSGAVGVSWDKKIYKWKAHIRVNGRMKHLGYFINKADAISARRAAEKKNGFHENHGDWDSQEPDPAPEVQLALFRPVAERPQQEERP